MKTITLILSLFLSLGCNNSDPQTPFQSTEITFTEIGKGALFGNGVENIGTIPVASALKSKVIVILL